MRWLAQSQLLGTHSTLASAATRRTQVSASEKAKPPGLKGPPLSAPPACRHESHSLATFRVNSVQASHYTHNQHRADQGGQPCGKMPVRTWAREASADVSNSVPRRRRRCQSAGGARPRPAAAAPAPGTAARPPRCSPAVDRPAHRRAVCSVFLKAQEVFGSAIAGELPEQTRQSQPAPTE